MIMAQNERKWAIIGCYGVFILVFFIIFTKHFYRWREIMTRKELATAYNVSTSTMRRWLRRMNIEATDHRITPKELEFIVNELGDPVVYTQFQKSQKVRELSTR